ncbi:TolC family protein [Niabella defluvii]|nr:TolC family protein [Niabella sp. I65]
MTFCFEKWTHRIGLTITGVLCFWGVHLNAQSQTGDTTLQQATLEGIINYALTHQPAVKQAEINQEITDLQIKNRLADWYPQLNFNYNYQRNFQLPVNIIGAIRYGLGYLILPRCNLLLPRIFLTAMPCWRAVQKKMCDW